MGCRCDSRHRSLYTAVTLETPISLSAHLWRKPAGIRKLHTHTAEVRLQPQMLKMRQQCDPHSLPFLPSMGAALLPALDGAPCLSFLVLFCLFFRFLSSRVCIADGEMVGDRPGRGRGERLSAIKVPSLTGSQITRRHINTQRSHMHYRCAVGVLHKAHGLCTSRALRGRVTGQAVLCSYIRIHANPPPMQVPLLAHLVLSAAEECSVLILHAHELGMTALLEQLPVLHQNHLVAFGQVLQWQICRNNAIGNACHDHRWDSNEQPSGQTPKALTSIPAPRCPLPHL